MHFLNTLVFGVKQKLVIPEKKVVHCAHCGLQWCKRFSRACTLICALIQSQCLWGLQTISWTSWLGLYSPALSTEVEFTTTFYHISNLPRPKPSHRNVKGNLRVPMIRAGLWLTPMEWRSLTLTLIETLTTTLIVWDSVFQSDSWQNKINVQV